MKMSILAVKHDCTVHLRHSYVAIKIFHISINFHIGFGTTWFSHISPSSNATRDVEKLYSFPRLKIVKFQTTRHSPAPEAAGKTHTIIFHKYFYGRTLSTEEGMFSASEQNDTHFYSTRYAIRTDKLTLIFYLHRVIEPDLSML